MFLRQLDLFTDFLLRNSFLCGSKNALWNGLTWIRLTCRLMLHDVFRGAMYTFGSFQASDVRIHFLSNELEYLLFRLKRQAVITNKLFSSSLRIFSWNKRNHSIEPVCIIIMNMYFFFIIPLPVQLYCSMICHRSDRRYVISIDPMGRSFRLFRKAMLFLMLNNFNV